MTWSFDIKVLGLDGVEEVHPDAITGAIIKTEDESDDDGDEAPGRH